MATTALPRMRRQKPRGSAAHAQCEDELLVNRRLRVRGGGASVCLVFPPLMRLPLGEEPRTRKCALTWSCGASLPWSESAAPSFFTCPEPVDLSMNARVLVLYFAKSVELTGVKEELVAVPTPLRTQDLWSLLLQRHQRLSALQGQVVLAVQQQYVAIGDQVVTLRDGDEVAVVPPLSGG
ncbi:uncharacterized protein V6R79_001311 [Siganus canaliculatus]